MRLQSKSYYLAALISLLLISTTTTLLAAELIRFGIMSLAQPARIYQQWQPFVDYVEKKSGYKIEIIIPRGFNKIKKKIENKHVDMFYTNSYVFYRLNQAGKALPLAQMQNLEGNIMSNSVIFVRSDSGINNLNELKNKSVAFVSPAGAGGYLAPRALFFKQGLNTKNDIKEKFTKNLTSSITKVLLGDVGAATMCGLNYKLMSKKTNTGELKVIAISEEYPENMIGIRPEVSATIREKITKIILNMANDKEGKKVLTGMNEMKIKSFVQPSQATMQRTKELINTAKM
jgi:phosphonate transport system substrate-binding protein